MRKLLLMMIFTIVIFSTESCRDMEELNISEVYANSDVKEIDMKFAASNKNDSIKMEERPKDPIKWGVVKDSLGIKK